MTKYPAILQVGFCIAYCLSLGISGDNLTLPSVRYSIVIHSRDNKLLHINHAK